MENKIKELIEKYNSDRIHDIALKEGVGVYDEIIEDLQSLLEFKQKNCCGKVGENENDKDKT